MLTYPFMGRNTLKAYPFFFFFFFFFFFIIIIFGFIMPFRERILSLTLYKLIIKNLNVIC